RSGSLRHGKDRIADRSHATLDRPEDLLVARVGRWYRHPDGQGHAIHPIGGARRLDPEGGGAKEGGDAVGLRIVGGGQDEPRDAPEVRARLLAERSERIVREDQRRIGLLPEKDLPRAELPGPVAGTTAREADSVGITEAPRQDIPGADRIPTAGRKGQAHE